MKVVVLGMGGTIAGVGDASAPRGYRAGELPIETLLATAGASAAGAVFSEQVAQVDSKDMDETLWVRLGQRVRHWLGQEDVVGVVVTHGTDTLEETAFFLHLAVDAAKPVVLTGSMRPATDAQPDGPGNLRDATLLASSVGVRGVLVVFAGQVFAGSEVRKVHPLRNDAFEAGDAGCVARIESGGVRQLREWPVAGADYQPRSLDCLANWLDEGRPLPWIAWLTSHAGATGNTVRALVAAGVQGLVIGGTGNASLNSRLESALDEARTAGVLVEVGSRCSSGDAEPVQAGESGLALQPAKARIAMQLGLIVSRTKLSSKGLRMRVR